jgi:hypothetical protein
MGAQAVRSADAPEPAWGANGVTRRTAATLCGV